MKSFHLGAAETVLAAKKRANTKKKNLEKFILKVLNLNCVIQNSNAMLGTEWYRFGKSEYFIDGSSPISATAMLGVVIRE